MKLQRLRGFKGWHAVALVALAAPYFVHLGKSSLWDANEAFYAETPREMLEAGDFLAPRFNYQPRPQKPPLTYWVLLASYRVLGVSELSVRVPGALAALAVILLTYATARRLFSRSAGLVAAVVIATTARFFILARRLPIDILLLAALTACAYLLTRIAAGEASRRNWALLYLLLGLGFLTKGPVAWLIPALAWLLYCLVTDRTRWRHVHPALGLGILAAVVLPWYVLIYRAHGWTYIERFFVKDNLARFATESFGPARGPSYYFAAYFVDFFPWSALSAVVLYYLWTERRNLLEPSHRGMLLPALWCAVTFVFFSLSRNKQEYYIAPLYPMMAVLIGGVFERSRIAERVAPPSPNRWGAAWAWALFTVSLLLFGAGVAALAVLRSLLPELQPVFHLLPFALLSAASLGLILCLVRGRPAAAFATLAVACGATIAVAPALYLPIVERYRPVKALCSVVSQQARAGDTVGYYRGAFPSMVFYLRRPIFEEIDPEAMVRRFQSPERVYCVLTESDYNYFVGTRDLILYVLDRRARLITQLRTLLDEENWAGQELLLVSNRPIPEEGVRDGREIP